MVLSTSYRRLPFFRKIPTYWIVLFLLFYTAIPHYGVIHNVTLLHTWGYLGTLLMFCFIVLGWKKKYVKVIGYVFSALLSINNSLSLLSRHLYKSPFSSDMALSVYETNVAEAREMFIVLWPGLVFLLAYAAVLILLLTILGKRLSPLWQKKPLSPFWVMALLVQLPLFFTQESWSQRIGLDKTFSDLLSLSSFPVAGSFAEAACDMLEIQRYAGHSPSLPKLAVDAQTPRVVVLIMGESALRSEMSLYGCQEKTTPIADRLKDDLLIYRHAVSPATKTATAIPLELCRMSPEEGFRSEMLSDNVVSLANHTGAWHTVWISNQGEKGRYDNTVSAIANYADTKAWTDKKGIGEAGPDEELLPLLDRALSETSPEDRLFVIMHLMGSHSNVSERYPHTPDYDIFDTKDEPRNEYLSSILYTDYIFGEVIKRVKDRPAVVIYTSDHAQSRFPGDIYKHSDTQEGCDVPLFVWHSASLSKAYDRRGVTVTKPTSTTELYNICSDYLGITGIEPKAPNDSLLVLIRRTEVIPYNKLPKSLRDN